MTLLAIGAESFSDNRRCRAWRRNRVGVPVDQLPITALQPKCACHAKGDGNHFLAFANLGSNVLNFDHARKILREILCDEFDARNFPISVVGCGSGQSFSNGLATTCKRPERIAKRQLLILDVQGQIAAWVAIHDLGECLVACFYSAVETMRAHTMSPCVPLPPATRRSSLGVLIASAYTRASRDANPDPAGYTFHYTRRACGSEH